ncbi:hypothetical protein F5Y11DRAFT_319758 [Daldinia sp. FL1419]|nr:hypothetical protein F5Y11DRAFT_319758 [Daldinia sp. FL1419]
MPSKDASAPSASEQKFFTTIFKYLPNGMDIDWNKFAFELGLKDAKIARTRFSQIRRKYQQEGCPGASPQQSKVMKASKSPKAKKAKLARKGRGKGDSAEDDDEDMKPVAKKEDSDEDVIKAEHEEDEVVSAKK